MQCTACSRILPEDAKFCDQCGQPRSRACPSCGHPARADARFCSQCGTGLEVVLGAPSVPAASSAPAPSPMPPPSPGVLPSPGLSASSLIDPSPPSPRTADPAQPADRRQLTVMFCDLVESTDLSSRLDPEEFREVVAEYQRACAQVIERFDGHVAQLLGDGLLVYFGFPQAYEDNARRAVLAGLGILEAIDRLRPTPCVVLGTRLRVRMGIHTGQVVVGAMGLAGHQEQLALGTAPNIAARLQSLADPGHLLVSEASRNLTEEFILFDDLGWRRLKGIPDPVRVFRVLGQRAAAGFGRSYDRALTPLVGRESEARKLEKLWQRACGGDGQGVFLCGEAGIGKSRLVSHAHELARAARGSGLELRCSPYHQQSAFYSIIDHLQQALELPDDAPSEQRLERLEALLSPHADRLDEWIPLFAGLLSLELPEGRWPELDLSGEKRNEKTREAVAEWFLRRSEEAPVLVVWEDLHWADPSSLELLGHLLERTSAGKLLLLMTFRPDFVPPWSVGEGLWRIDLDSLAPADVERIVEKIAGKPLPPAVVRQLVAKTDGVPLFVEELTKMVLESGILEEQDDRFVLAGPLPALAIPATLRDSLMARLDRLKDVREVAQLGATLGREFTYRLIRQVASMDELTLRRGLAQLEEAELIFREGQPPESKYIFKHALIQDLAYKSLLRRTRRSYHRSIADALTEHFPQVAEAQPELVAHHYTEGELFGEAIDYWHRAGEKAAQRSANPEALSHLERGIELTRHLPEARERAQWELKLRSTLNGALFANRGPALPEVQEAFARSLELCREVGDSTELFRIQIGLFLYYNARAMLSKARELATEMEVQAENDGDAGLMTIAHHAQGTCRFFLGEPRSARVHLERADTLFTEHHQETADRKMIDIGVSSPSYGSLSLWLLGYPDQALAQSSYARRRARLLRQPFSLARALCWASTLHVFLRDEAEVLVASEECVALSSRMGFPLWEAGARANHGWARIGDSGESALDDLRIGIDDWQQTATRVMVPHYLWLSAEALARLDRRDESLALIEPIRAQVEETDERWWEPEVHRLEGELVLADGDDTRAAGCYEKALSTARDRGSRSLELRAAMSLARLEQERGRSDGAFEQLWEIYGAFTEGFETADLVDARALLDQAPVPLRFSRG